jgi:putative ABC transport system ATP-binding protein
VGMVDRRGVHWFGFGARKFGGIMAGCQGRWRSPYDDYPRRWRHDLSSSTQQAPVISAVGLTKVYTRGREQVKALDHATFEVQPGEFVAIVGPSGAGKSTLLNLVGCMDAPSSGTLKLLGRPVEDLAEKDRTRFRRDQLGFVFQHFGLIPTLTVAENIALPALFARRSATEAVDQLLVKVGLEHRRSHRPQELSGGEMQRVAIARALINGPLLLLADEPTGNLDSVTGESIIELFEELNSEGLTILVVTHNQTLSETAHRCLQLVDGRLQDGSRTGLPAPQAIAKIQTGLH